MTKKNFERIKLNLPKIWKKNYIKKINFKKL